MRNIASLLALAGMLLLSACDWGKKREDELLPVNNAGDVVANESVAEPVPEAAPANETSANAANMVTPPPPPPLTEEEQMQDDADATGLTSRLPEDQTPTNMAAR